jgi:hypothetical protein
VEFKQSIHPSVFVIRKCNQSDTIDSIDELSALGDIKPLGKRLNLYRLFVTSQTEDDPKLTWQQLREKLGPQFDIEPAFIDENGIISYPTGQIMVRFEKAMTDKELNEFAREWGLRVNSRNKYVANQVVFEKTAITFNQYLPDILDSIRHRSDCVQSAWPVTISKYMKV